MVRTYLTHNKLDFVDLVCRQRIVSDWTATQGAVESVVASVADAGVELVTIPDLSANDNRVALHHSWPYVLCREVFHTYVRRAFATTLRCMYRRI